ncbi:hypothetical protein NLG97_g2645 [Lecanicillium saksenae]|uniref:Uncharacterized protein n=1 Tax=Lecanicillium saksenae TaxID=468837 RepID=A0ACC1R1S0_9HYPO|nr:hypothetical protein NLG97_g2645 [Lecanicillium saksenae]
MGLLLEQRGREITITEEVLKDAVRNEHNGREVMALLLEQRGSEITITEEVLKAAARNEYNGEEVITLLLEQQGHRFTITEKLVTIFARYFSKTVMALLLEQRGSEITITDKVVKAAAGNSRNGNAVITLLLQQRGSDISITEEIVTFIAQHFDKEVMALLLEQRGSEITITEAFKTWHRLNLSTRFPDIAARLDDEDPFVRSGALRALAGQAPPGGILRVVAARLDDQYSAVRTAAMHALGEFEALPGWVLMEVTARLNGDDELMRRAALRALGRRGALSDNILQSMAARLVFQGVRIAPQKLLNEALKEDELNWRISFVELNSPKDFFPPHLPRTPKLKELPATFKGSRECARVHPDVKQAVGYKRLIERIAVHQSDPHNDQRPAERRLVGCLAPGVTKQLVELVALGQTDAIEWTETGQPRLCHCPRVTCRRWQGQDAIEKHGSPVNARHEMYRWKVIHFDLFCPSIHVKLRYASVNGRCGWWCQWKSSSVVCRVLLVCGENAVTCDVNDGEKELGRARHVLGNVEAM